jgi:hypothetical protein
VDVLGPLLVAAPGPAYPDDLPADASPGGIGMALFGKKCSRCGRTRTKRTYEGLPTCEGCEALIEAKLQASRENRRPCPIDAAAMEKEILLNLVIDRCPACRGVWLDGGELEQMRSSIEEGLAHALIRGMTYPV